MAGETLSNIREIRISKAEKLRELGIDPYPSKSNRDTYTQEIIEDYENYENNEVIVAGRIMSFRGHGHLTFADIQDSNGRIQLYIKDDKLDKTSKKDQNIGFEHLNLFDIGDIVEARGIITKTKTGEISVLVKQLKMLTKSIRPLPDKWEGIKDKEKLFRKRYLDTILNPEKRKPFADAAKITFAIREFLNKKGFLEIQTPILQPIYGGGTAKPFKTRVNALDVDFYLAIAHELYLKRLITAGFENVYNISGYFRNEGIDRTHNPQFNMLETMTAFQNYEYNMDLIEEMYKYIANKVFDRSVFKVQGQDVDFGKTWERIMMVDAVKKYADIDFNEISSLNQAHKVLDEIGFKDEKAGTIGEVMVQVFEEKVEEQLIQPTFVYGHPVEISPLAKRMANKPKYVERFEIFIGGIEGGDNWTELNDPVELYERFKDQVDRGRRGQEEFHPMDVDFLETMEYGMPPTTGLGPGIERLQMMFTETEYIDDVLFFPMMKPAPITDIQKEIYGVDYLIQEEKDIIKTEPVELDKLTMENIAKINDDVIKKFEGIKTGYVIIEGVNVENSNEELEKFKSSILNKIKTRFSNNEDIKNNENIKGFRELYKSFGVDPNSRLNSAESLLRRIVKDKGLYEINNIVDTYNITSIEYQIPMAAYDLDKIKGKISLSISSENDSIHKIGDDSPTKIDKGELVYKDEDGVICLDYNYRDSNRTKITKDTKNIIIFVDGHENIEFSYIKKVLSEVAGRIQLFAGGYVSGYSLLPEDNIITTDNNSKKEIPSRLEAQDLLEKYVKDDYQRLHAKMVAEAMLAYAKKFNVDNPELWYQTGLLHDLDFDKWPENHPDDNKFRELTDNKYPDEFYEAIQGHAVYTNIPRKTKMAKTLLSVDELAGLFYAVAKMRPDGFDMKVKSLKKKFKDKKFAAKIDRSDILLGIEELDIEFKDHIEFLIPIFNQFNKYL